MGHNAKGATTPGLDTPFAGVATYPLPSIPGGPAPGPRLYTPISDFQQRNAAMREPIALAPETPEASALAQWRTIAEEGRSIVGSRRMDHFSRQNDPGLELGQEPFLDVSWRRGAGSQAVEIDDDALPRFIPFNAREVRAYLSERPGNGRRLSEVYTMTIGPARNASPTENVECVVQVECKPPAPVASSPAPAPTLVDQLSTLLATPLGGVLVTALMKTLEPKPDPALDLIKSSLVQRVVNPPAPPPPPQTDPLASFRQTAEMLKLAREISGDRSGKGSSATERVMDIIEKGVVAVGPQVVAAMTRPPPAPPPPPPPDPVDDEDEEFAEEGEEEVQGVEDGGAGQGDLLAFGMQALGVMNEEGINPADISPEQLRRMFRAMKQVQADKAKRASVPAPMPQASPASKIAQTELSHGLHPSPSAPVPAVAPTATQGTADNRETGQVSPAGHQEKLGDAQPEPAPEDIEHPVRGTILRKRTVIR